VIGWTAYVPFQNAFMSGNKPCAAGKISFMGGKSPSLSGKRLSVSGKMLSASGKISSARINRAFGRKNDSTSHYPVPY